MLQLLFALLLAGWGGVGGGTPSQPTLQEAGRVFSAHWSAGDAAALGGMMSPGGVRLNLEGGGHASVGVRQAVAALRDLHDLHRPGSTRITRVSAAGGDPPRGFAELQWSTVTGAGEPRTFSLFVGFVQEGGAWRVSEIRVLR